MQRPAVGIAVFVIKNGKFIMLLRQGSHAAGTWGLPGGHLEYGESWADCVRRETLEEVGLEITNIHFIAATNDIFEADSKHYVTIFMRADWLAGEAQNLEPQKCQKIDWVTLQTIPVPRMLPVTNLLKSKQNLQL